MKRGRTFDIAGRHIGMINGCRKRRRPALLECLGRLILLCFVAVDLSKRREGEEALPLGSTRRRSIATPLLGHDVPFASPIHVPQKEMSSVDMSDRHSARRRAHPRQPAR